MMFETWLQAVADSMGASLQGAGYIVSCIVILAMSLIGMIASRGRNLFGSMFLAFITMAIFIVFEWIGYWLLLVWVLLAAALWGDKIATWIGR